MTPNVVALTPIRNRAWAVGRHVASLKRQGPHLSGALYLTGDNKDDTDDTLWRAAADEIGRLPVVVEFNNSGSPFWSRDRKGEKYTGDDHKHLSEVYNRLIELGLETFPEASHFWLVDSDVFPEAGCLEKLLAAGDDWPPPTVVSPIVTHRPGVFNFIADTRDGVPRRSDTDHQIAEVHPGRWSVAFVSCCVLYPREVLEAREELTMTARVAGGEEEVVSEDSRYICRFAPHPRSHDFPMMEAVRKVARIVVDTGARAEHVMEAPR